MSELKNLKALLNITGSIPSTDAKRLIERVEELEEELSLEKSVSKSHEANLIRENQRYREAIEKHSENTQKYGDYTANQMLRKVLEGDDE